MRLFSCAFALWVASTAASTMASGQDIVPLFDGRNVVGKHGARPPDNQIPLPLKNLIALLGTQINAIAPERSLLLSDCGPSSVWCSQPDFQFTASMGRAASVASSTGSDLMQSWYRSASQDAVVKTLLNWNGTGQPPLQLLAIVNRMDQAQWTDPYWKGAEFRFVYGRKDDQHEMTLIVEFVLKPMEWDTFQHLGSAWAGLSDPAADLLSQLRSIFTRPENLAFDRVRIRTNVQHAPTWGFQEWDLTSSMKIYASQPLIASLLENQIHTRYVNAAPATADYQVYTTRLWPDITGMSPPRSIKISDVFWTLSAPYGSEDPLPTPIQYCATEVTRNTLALERCTGCHKLETNASFTHISNRPENGSSTLSGFLKGSDHHPSLIDLYYADTLFAVPVTYMTYLKGPSGICDQPANATTVRNFADLSRRQLFLTRLLSATPATAAQVTQFATDYSH